jgi:hypothetical protein
MRTYNQITEYLGYDFTVQCPITYTFKYFAYKNGEVKEFNTIKEAQLFSKNVEKSVNTENELKRDTWYKIRSEQISHVDAVWFKELKEEYKNSLSDEVFKLCYAEAYEKGHSSGYDEVACCMSDYVDFALNVLRKAFSTS